MRVICVRVNDYRPIACRVSCNIGFVSSKCSCFIEFSLVTVIVWNLCQNILAKFLAEKSSNTGEARYELAKKFTQRKEGPKFCLLGWILLPLDIRRRPDSLFIRLGRITCPRKLEWLARNEKFFKTGFSQLLLCSMGTGSTCDVWSLKVLERTPVSCWYSRLYSYMTNDRITCLPL